VVVSEKRRRRGGGRGIHGDEEVDVIGMERKQMIVGVLVLPLLPK